MDERIETHRGTLRKQGGARGQSVEAGVAPKNYVGPAARERETMAASRRKIGVARREPHMAEKMRRQEEAAKTSEELLLGSTTLEPRFPPTTVSRKYKVFYHDGVWDPKLGKNGAWSDNMAEKKSDPGPCYKIVNPDAWNFAGP